MVGGSGFPDDGSGCRGDTVVHVRGFPYPLREGGMQELIRPEERDLFR